jgi:hypothetical protein
MDFRPSRRRFLLSAAVVTIGPAVVPVAELLRAAGAQEAVPTAAELAAFAETVELATASLYGALRGRVSRPQAVSAITAYTKHHQDHAGAIGALAGDKRVGKPNPVLMPVITDRLNRAATENDVIRVAADIENGLASTYLFVIDSITDAAALKMAAAILPVEAEHAVSLGTLIGQDTKTLTAPDTQSDGTSLGYETEARHFDPSQYPTSETTTTTTVAKQ